jgi:hypothetical protein
MNASRSIVAVTLSTAVVSTLLIVQSAVAVPVQGEFVDDPTRCDPVPDILLTHELGTGTAADPFPIDELIFADALQTSQVVCVGDDGVANDWEVRIVNLSNNYWKDLFFVVDEGFGVGNADGYAQDLAAPGFTEAFRIDGTVTITGMNDNLLAESGTADEIFEPGEAWSFLVSNFLAPGPPTFDSFGFSVSSAGGPPSNASILANLVPEPTSLMLLVLGGLPLLARRRRGSRN